jgi:hypothetical protein
MMAAILGVLKIIKFWLNTEGFSSERGVKLVSVIVLVNRTYVAAQL